MRNPTVRQVTRLIARLRKIERVANDGFDMLGASVGKNEFMCVAGWYVWQQRHTKRVINVRNLNFKNGADLMAYHLGYTRMRKNRDTLKMWANLNPSIWGNTHGYYMFSSYDAYNELAHNMDKQPMTTVIKHWEGVLHRLEALKI